MVTIYVLRHTLRHYQAIRDSYDKYIKHSEIKNYFFTNIFINIAA